MKNTARLLVLLLLTFCMMLPLASCVSVTRTGRSASANAYDVAVAQGYTGTVDEWLASLKGDSAYDIWLKQGNTGSEADFLASLSTTINQYNVTVEGQDSETVPSKALLSVVSVYSSFVKTYTVRTGYYRTEERQTTYSAAGSGVIYRMDKTAGDAYVITNYHVVYDKENETTASGVSADIKLYLYGMEYEKYAIPATYVGGSMYYDIAVLKISGNDILRTSAAMEAELLPEDENITVGRKAIAVGNPEALGISATSGVISVDSEYINMTAADGSTVVSMRVVRIDTAINSGNSGGGLFDASGRLIGITNAKIVDTSTENIAYAIPVRIAERVADNIIDYCADSTCQSVRRCILGVTVGAAASTATYDPETNSVAIRETVTVSEVSAEGAMKGKLQTGDTIVSLSIADKTYAVDRTFMLIDAMLTARVGDTVTFHILRGGEAQNVTVTVTEDMLTDY